MAGRDGLQMEKKKLSEMLGPGKHDSTAYTNI